MTRLIGILGGGQLGRMLALAGYPLGLRFRFLDPAPDAPLRHLAQQVCGAYDDDDALARFSDGLQVVTYEFENVPVATVERLARSLPLFPPPRALAVAQDRLDEKTFFNALGIRTAPFAPVDMRADLDDAVKRIGLPAVLKTRRFGYDGKGQFILRAPDDCDPAWRALGGRALILEGFVPFARELSIIAARSHDGALAFYPLVENYHRDGILRLSLAPAPHSAGLQAQADQIAARALDALDYVGVLAIELFECDGQLLANEMAPRVHNSGHWSIEGAQTSQFANHLRAVLGLPLGDTRMRGHAALLNLIGAIPDAAAVLRIPGAYLHLYDKTPRPGRKIGHITLVADDETQLRERLAQAQELTEWVTQIPSRDERMTDLDRPREECGLIGIYAPNEDVARMAYFGLHALQHRGQEAAGIAVSDGVTAHIHKDVGLVTQVFTPQNLTPLQGHYAIGHTRYSTTGSSAARNAQPFLIETAHGPLAVAHNGNLVNAGELRNEVLKRGVGLSSSSDSEVITMMLAGAAGDNWEERIQHAMAQWHGAYSLVILTRENVFAVRDPWGFRPLSVGRLPGGGHAAASETGALRTLGCQVIREVKPGEIVTLSTNNLRVRQGLPPAPHSARCVFEHIYFSRPDSFWHGLSVHHVRQRLGEQLARECPTEADAVVPVPDSSVPAAIGYARVSGIPYNDGFIKNRYIGRTFIQPTDSLRKQGIALKFNALPENVRGLRVIMIDDSIVRGNTAGPLVKLLREAGAREVHVRLTCPPIAHPCYMGVDMGTYEELLAHRMMLDEMRDHIDCDSLHFLSLEGMMSAVGHQEGYCHACFTGLYPIEIDFGLTKTGFEKAIR